MGRIGFWQLLLDDRMSWWEAQRINEAHDAADIAANDAQAAHFRAQTLEQRVTSMSREIVMLRTALTVLTNTLKDGKVLDERLLDARLQAALEEAEEASKPKPIAAAAPYTPPQITCIRCRKGVPASSTLMTADGPMCERQCSP